MGKQFLVIEDSPDDAALIRRAFDAVEGCNAFVCRNISEAKAYVQGAGMYGDRKLFPFPNGVICDIRLGEESGTQFLSWLKGTQFKKLPVFILSGASPKELSAAKAFKPVAVLKKPARFEELQSMLNDLAGKLCT